MAAPASEREHGADDRAGDGHQRGLEQEGAEDRSAPHADEAHHRGVHPPLLHLEQHDAEQEDGAGDDGDDGDGAVKAAHHEKGLRGLRGDRRRSDTPGSRTRCCSSAATALSTDAPGSEADPEAVHPVGRAEQRGEVRAGAAGRAARPW